MKYFACFFALFTCSCGLSDDPPQKWQIGHTVMLGEKKALPGAERYYFEVLKVFDLDETYVRGVHLIEAGPLFDMPVEIETHPPFIVKGLSTKKPAPGAQIQLVGKYKVIEQREIEDSNVFVLERVPAEKPK